MRDWNVWFKVCLLCLFLLGCEQKDTHSNSANLNMPVSADEILAVFSEKLGNDLTDLQKEQVIAEIRRQVDAIDSAFWAPSESTKEVFTPEKLATTVRGDVDNLKSRRCEQQHVNSGHIDVARASCELDIDTGKMVVDISDAKKSPVYLFPYMAELSSDGFHYDEKFHIAYKGKSDETQEHKVIMAIVDNRFLVLMMAENLPPQDSLDQIKSFVRISGLVD